MMGIQLIPNHLFNISRGEYYKILRSDPNGTYLSQNVGWVSVFCVIARDGEILTMQEHLSVNPPSVA